MLTKMNSQSFSDENRKQLFISWSGETGKKVADLIYDWMDRIYEDVNSKVFFSTRIRSGRHGFTDIINALNDCKKGFFIITRERVNSPWLHFEAGAVFKANNENDIIPIYVALKREWITNDPLIDFQSTISFEYDGIHNLILQTAQELKWKQRDLYEGGLEKINTEFKKRVDDLINEITPDPIVSMLDENRSIFNNCFKNEDSGCLAHLDENTFFGIRKIAVENAKGELLIAGPSLTEAIGSGITDNRSLRIVIEDGIRKKRITSIKLLLTDLSIFESDCTESNEAISRVMGSLNFIKNELFHVCDECECDISVYFIPLHNIDHVVMTDKYMLYRSTKLWTSNGEYKGEFTLYQNSGAQSEYSVQHMYLNKLMELCTTINLDIDTVSNNQDSYIAREIKNWRLNIKQKGGHTPNSGHRGELKNIHLYKLYYSQLTHYIACDWNGPNHSELRFCPSEHITNPNALFNSENLLGDETQRYLVDYIKKTEDLLRGVVEKYSTASINGDKLSEAYVFPSLDLGLPNNSVRLAGGFATGMLVTWKCGTPIVPVDATVNVCSSSVFELPYTYNLNQTDEEFSNKIQELIHKAITAGYAFNFSSGNHFLMIATDENGLKYLVLHSSAKEFKDSYIGLYPTEGNWYSEKIRTYPTPYVRGERYIRYLKGDDAVFFISMAKKLEDMNVQIHNFFADEMNANQCSLLSKSTYHHYYMPTNSSIAIGTFVEEPGTTVPIFSAPGKEICLFKVAPDQNWTIQLGGKPKCLIPHGWGQAISGRINTFVDYAEKKFTIQVNNKIYEHYLPRDKQIKCPEKKIRQFNSCEDFLGLQNFIKGQIVRKLTPEFLFCSSIKGKVHK